MTRKGAPFKLGLRVICDTVPSACLCHPEKHLQTKAIDGCRRGSRPRWDRPKKAEAAAEIFQEIRFNLLRDGSQQEGKLCLAAQLSHFVIARKARAG
jgi:hypothetical protein